MPLHFLGTSAAPSQPLPSLTIGRLPVVWPGPGFKLQFPGACQGLVWPGFVFPGGEHVVYKASIAACCIQLEMPCSEKKNLQYQGEATLQPSISHVKMV